MRTMLDEMNEAASVDPDDAHRETLLKTGFWGEQGAGCVIFAEDTKRFLIAHRSNEVEQPGTWGTWGGAVDKGSSLKDTIIKEIKEETGFEGKIKEIIPLYVFAKGSFKYHNFVVVVDKEFVPKLNWENKGYEWCLWGNWPSPLHFGLQALLKHTTSVATIKSLLSR